ncbi:hypothetical protein K1719_023263 [Acacia pycnantha]|nr:hypothetical protein K1719_023263 [Acacia pycnantha]
MDNHVVYGWVAGLTCSFLLLMMVTPRIPQPQNYHDFADKRKFFGIPNAPDVISNFPFLVIGLIGLRLCNHGNYFKISSQGERWGWMSFYVGMISVAFGSSYYHLKPNDDRLVWDRLPMTVGAASILAIFIIERIDEKKGTMLHQDLRLYGLFQFVPCIAIALIGILVPSKYTHSTYWLWAAGFYLLARMGEATDRVTFKLTFHTVSGHTIKHLSAFMIPVVLALMLAKRNIDVKRFMKETPMVRAITEEPNFMYYEMKGLKCIIEQLQQLMFKL